MQERELINSREASDHDHAALKRSGICSSTVARPRMYKLENNMNTANVKNNHSNHNNSSTDVNNENNTNATTNANNNNQQAMRCPRCDSSNTKFCYYNNYSLLQPRYFCKSCRRYWTKGGALRNVPIGGGCRKNKRLSRQRLVPANSADHHLIPPSAGTGAAANHLLSHGHSGLDHPSPFPFSNDHHEYLPTIIRPPLSLFPPPDHPHPRNMLYFNLPPDDNINDLKGPSLQSGMAPIPADAAPPDQHPYSQALFSRQLASYLPPSVASQYLGALPMHNVGFNPASSNSECQGDMHSAYNHEARNPSHHTAQADPSLQRVTTLVEDRTAPAGFKTFSLPFENFNASLEHHPNLGWGNNIKPLIIHDEKLFTNPKINQHITSRSAHLENLGNLQQEGPSRYTTQLRPPKTELDQSGGWPGQRAEEPAAPAAHDQAPNYWSNAAAAGWQDMSGYDAASDHPTSDHLFM